MVCHNEIAKDGAGNFAVPLTFPSLGANLVLSKDDLLMVSTFGLPFSLIPSVLGTGTILGRL